MEGTHAAGLIHVVGFTVNVNFTVRVLLRVSFTVAVKSYVRPGFNIVTGTNLNPLTPSTEAIPVTDVTDPIFNVIFAVVRLLTSRKLSVATKIPGKLSGDTKISPPAGEIATIFGDGHAAFARESVSAVCVLPLGHVKVAEDVPPPPPQAASPRTSATLASIEGIRFFIVNMNKFIIRLLLPKMGVVPDMGVVIEQKDSSDEFFRFSNA